MQLKDIAAELETHEYPLTSEELAARHADETLDLPNGTEQMGAVFEVFTEETYANAEEARAALYCGIGSNAIGRKGYSDRDPTPLGADDHEPLSF